MVLWLDQAALCSHKMSESATAGDVGPVRGALDSGFTEEPVGLWENASVDLFLDEICTDMGLKSVPLTFPPSICPGNATDFNEVDGVEQQKVSSNVSGLEEAWGQERPLSKDEEVLTFVSTPQPEFPPVLSLPEPSWAGEVMPLGTETNPASFSLLLPTAPLKVPNSAVVHGPAAVPACTPLQVTSHPEGLRTMRRQPVRAFVSHRLSTLVTGRRRGSELPGLWVCRSGCPDRWGLLDGLLWGGSDK